MSASSYVTVKGEVKIKAQTDKALRVEIEDKGEIWIPKSVVADADDYKPGDVGTLSILKWFADKEEIETEE
jgi:hypothetical protein